MHRLRTLVLAALFAATATACSAADPNLQSLTLPPGFAIAPYAQVPGARSLSVAPPLGVVFVGTRSNSVFAIVDADRDNKPEKVVRVLSGLKVPNGIAWRDGYLYVAEQHRVVRFRAGSLKELAASRPQVLFGRLPDNRWHGWRYAAFGPDGWLYVAVGAPCNICRIKGMEGTIIRIRPPRGGQSVGTLRPEIFARGIRNSVGLAFHPVTKSLYFTDNGADYMGDDLPPEELNHAPRAGLHFGYPYYGGGDARTPDFRDETPPQKTTLPVVRFAAHNAALGLHFYQGSMLPSEYRHDAFVAQHGSWNRSDPDGYRVVRVRFDKNHKATGFEPFIEGWLQADGSAWGRPVDVTELPDGSLLLSDDRQGLVYRITYRK
ncbi:MAG: PQQ-dependent sugar dehydrogenase [Rhodospirillales bacterium]|nr:PQQ-dependent sugar dehydrogenase [Rhodospirillales bacterium]